MQICFCPVATHVLAVWPVMGLQVMLPIVYKCNANQRAIDQRGFQYDMLVYQAAVKERYCRQKMQAAQNAEISKSNDQALKYAELTNTLPPPMRQAVWEDFPEPVRPQPPISGLQQAAAAAAVAGAQASDRAAVAPTPYTVMPQGRKLAFTPALVGSEAAALHASTALSGSRGRGPNGVSVTGTPANPEGAGS